VFERGAVASSTSARWPQTTRCGWEHTLQLLPGPERYSYVRARVEIQEWLDGSLVIAYQGRIIANIL